MIDRGFAIFQRWALRAVVIAAAAYVLGWVVGRTWMIWFPVALALVIATVLAPPVTWLRRRRVPDGLAAAAVMIGFNWIYERNEPAWATPTVTWLGGFFPGKGSYGAKQQTTTPPAKPVAAKRS